MQDITVYAWNSRDLSEVTYPCMTVDAMYVKVHEDSQIRSRGVFIGYGVNTDGNR